MKRTKMFLTAVLAACAVATVSAQETVIIRKNKDSKEKTTVVIDGDNVTVNGKPLSEYKGSDVEVSRGLRELRALNGTYSRIAPIPRGGVQAFGGDSWFASTSNSAMLGVLTEKSDEGAKISEITKESAAAKAGLKEGDIITKVGDKKIEDAEDLHNAIGKHKPEDKVEVTYKRDGKTATTTATLGKNTTSRVWSSQGIAPSIAFDNLGSTFYFPRRPRVGIQIQDTEDETGVKVLDVDENTAADKAGLKEGDVITEANGKAVKNLADIREEMKELKEGDTLKLKYKRGGTVSSADIKFPKRLEKANF
jgi:serine protease Do